LWHKSVRGGRGWIVWSGGSGRRSRFAAQNLEHDRAANRAFAFDRLAPVFHCFLDAIGNVPLGLAFDAISLSHKIFAARASCPNGGSRIAKPNPKRKFEKELKKGVEIQLFAEPASFDVLQNAANDWSADGSSAFLLQ
jgi:hypothetical protein